MIVKAITTRVFKEGEDLFDFITNYFKTIPEKSIVIVTSKIVALSERRTALVHTKHEKDRLIRAESEFALRTKYVWLTIKDGIVMPSAGVDESNANGKIILLPRDSFVAARMLRKKLQKKYKIKKIGVLITDSHTMPFRSGVIGITLGYAGIKGLKDYRGKPDIFGRKFKFSQTNIADSLATAAVFTMGEGNEQQPLALITGAKVQFSNTSRRTELHIDVQDDMYRPLFAKLPFKK